MKTTPSGVAFDIRLMAEDMAVAGLNKADLADRACVSDMTVIRFLRGERQTNRTAKKLAKGLGYSVRRYLIRTPQEAA
jgi:transcriptional regulator with XRE-family HTH domain